MTLTKIADQPFACKPFFGCVTGVNVLGFFVALDEIFAVVLVWLVDICRFF